VRRLPYLRAEVVHAVSSEMALTLSDILVRRTKLAFETHGAEAEEATRVATALASPLLGWSADARQGAVDAYRRDRSRMFGIAEG
jgi:glycerol-3-phosphate dehydrogenase